MRTDYIVQNKFKGIWTGLWWFDAPDKAKNFCRERTAQTGGVYRVVEEKWVAVYKVLR